MTTDPDLLAFVAAIRADPGEHTPQLVFADWLQERGDDDRAELVRAQVELAQYWPVKPLQRWDTRPESDPTHHCLICGALWVLWPGDGGWSLRSDDCGKCCDNAAMGTQIDALAPPVLRLLRRVRELEASLAAWPCPNAIHGPPYSAKKGTTCPACGGGDVLKRPNNPHPWQDAVPLPLRWLAGFPQFTTLPALADAVWLSRSREVGERVVEEVPDRHIPTPRLLALAAVPPWGVPLEGVLVADREPYFNGAGHVWYNASVPHAGRPGESELPEPLFLALKEWTPGKTKGGRWRPYPTPELARLALGRAVLAFARGESP